MVEIDCMLIMIILYCCTIAWTLGMLCGTCERRFDQFHVIQSNDPVKSNDVTSVTNHHKTYCNDTTTITTTITKTHTLVESKSVNGFHSHVDYHPFFVIESSPCKQLHSEHQFVCQHKTRFLGKISPLFQKTNN